MKKYGVILGGAAILLIAVLSMGSFGAGTGAESANGGPVTFSVSATSNNPFAEAAKAGGPGVAAAAADPNISLYFFPQDSAATTTVLYVANPTARRIGIWGWRYSWGGSLLPTPLKGTQDPGTMARIYSDATVVAVGIHWDLGPETAYVELELPPDVVVDGYIAWNSASQYNPDVAVQTLPLRFSKGPTR